MEIKPKVKIPLPRIQDLKKESPEEDLSMDSEPKIEPIECTHRINAKTFFATGIMVCGVCKQALLTNQGWVLFDAEVDVEEKKA